MANNQPIRVLVFGSSGTGKTTICNYLSNDTQPTSDSPLGSTFETYVYPEFAINENSLILTDTVGLNESSKGTVKSATAISNLVKLLKESHEGYNLLIHVVKTGRLDNNTVENYNLFIKSIADNKIPVILVATHGDTLDDEKPMSNWATENKDTIGNVLGLKYKKILVVSFKRSSKSAFEEIYLGYRDQSISELVEAIETYSAMTPVKIYETRNDFVAVFMRSWNTFCGFFGINTLRYKINQGIRTILRSLGLDDSEVEKIATEFD